MKIPAAALLMLSLAACSSPRRAIATDRAPKAIGPYSQAVEAGGFVLVSGQIAPDAGDIRAQTHQALKNIEAVLSAAGLSLRNVVKTTVYMVDLAEFGAMNEVYAGYFPSAPPARATVQVAALPKGARIEIEAIAAK